MGRGGGQLGELGQVVGVEARGQALWGLGGCFSNVAFILRALGRV